MKFDLKHLRAVNALLATALVVLLLLIQATGAEPEPAAPEPGELLYVTTFDAFNDEWTLFPGQMSAGVASGQLQIQIGKADDGTFSILDREFRDFDMTVIATQLEGDDDNTGYGVVFRHLDELNHYHFLISGDGYYKVTRVLDGQAKTLTADWRPSEYINQGDAANVIRVVGQGDTFQFYVNGHLLTDLCTGEQVTAFDCGGGTLSAELVDDTFARGSAGVAALSLYASGVVIGFDDIVITAPGVPEAGG